MTTPATFTEPFIVTCLRLPKSLHTRLKLYALTQDETMNAVVSAWVRQALDHYQRPNGGTDGSPEP